MTKRNIHNLFTINLPLAGPRFWRNATVWCCLFLSGLNPLVLAAQGPTGAAVKTKEYFNNQMPDTALVIRLEAFETEFESKVFAPDNFLLKFSGVPSLRLGPIFQFIEPVDKPRQLRMEITLGRSTSRSKLDMRLIKFDESGPDNSILLQAYRLLSFGLEMQKSNRQDAWTMKVVSLSQAANIFNSLGMQELQLWSQFYSYYYLLVVLGDPITAAEGSRDIFPAATRSGFKDLALAALQLEGSATVAQVNPANTKTSDALFKRAQALFAQAAELAAAMDLQYERARALYNSGLAFEAAQQSTEAFRQFDLALDIANASGDTEMANQIRQHAAELHESLGENSAAITLMQEISASAVTEESNAEPDPEVAAAPAKVVPADQEMVSYLFDQGRLLEKTYRHQEAADVLLQALALDQKSPSPAQTGPVMMLLAKALYGAGQAETALSYLQEGIEKTPASRYGKELEEAFGLLATIQRVRGDYAGMAAARARQDQFTTAPPARAAFTYEKALDALAQSGSKSSAARDLLRQSQSLAKQGGAPSLQHLAVLQLCALGESASATEDSCLGATGQQALTALNASGLPGVSQQARLLWSQALRRSGQVAQSTAELDRLIEDLRFFQSALPGVLGAWYWQNSETVFSAFMNQTLEQAVASSGEAAALQSLTALDRLSRMDQTQAISGGTAGMAGDAELNRLRSLFAARDAAESGAEASRLDGEIAQLTGQLSAQMAKPAESGANIAGRIHRLSGDEAFLTYYLAEASAYAWLGRNDGLKLVSIPWSANQSADLSRTVEGLRWDLAKGNSANFAGVMDSLGQQLLAPLARQLPGKIYFLPMGRMEGLPLDALRWNDEFLATRHRVINLLTLDALGASDSRVESSDLQRFFLSGNQQAGAGDFGVFKPTPVEIKTIADLFIGPGLRIVQGSALQWDEFETEEFTRAGVIHLAMPGVIDLREPAQSRLLLSDNTDDVAHEFLLPGDIHEKSFSAKLVVLSASDFIGTSKSAFATNTRFVGEFLEAGAGAVMVSLWSVGDSLAAEFMQRFYRQLMVNPIVGEALADTKRTYLQGPGSGDTGAWAAFQLFMD